MRIERKPTVILFADDDEENRMAACDAPAGDSVL